MNRTQEEITRLLETLIKEKKHDRERYEAGLLNSSQAIRVSRGLSWQPLNIKDTGYGLGDYPYLVVERTKHKGKDHKFSAGKSVTLYLVNGDSQYENINGTINWVDKDTMKIIFTNDDLPDWIHHGSIGLNLSFDEKSYKEMENALHTLLAAKKNRIAELSQIILGHAAAQKRDTADYLTLPNLNASQNKAVQAITECRDVVAVHGPPGTGKTTTLVEAVNILAKKYQNILVCAPSNTATDLLTEKIAGKGLSVIRIGNISRVDEGVISHTLEYCISEHKRAREIKTMKQKANEYRKMASKYKRNFGREEREQRRQLYKEAKSLARDAVELEEYIIDDILDKADVITCTLVGANNRYLKERLFPICIIDEAAQALEPASWIPILKSNKVILAGDPFQLPPTVKSDAGRKNGLEHTLLEKVIERTDDVLLLDTQYRMNNVIMGFSNQEFYCDQLKADDSVKNHRLEIIESKPLQLIDTAGCGFEEKQNEESQSLFNPEEATILKKHLELLLTENSSLNIGVISPYKAQVLYLKEFLGEEFLSSYDVTVNTIDSFQGQEKDFIYISMVRSNDRNEIGFLKDTRRMNVAMTRAKKKLVIIGDSATLGSHKFYNSFLDYCELNDAYHTAWEFMV